MKTKTHAHVPELQEQYREGGITRREFTRRAALLGVSMSGISAFLASCAAPATEPTPTAVPKPPLAPTPAATPSPTPTGPYGQLVLAVATFGLETFNPVTNNRGTKGNFTAPMFDYLVRMDPSERVSTGVAERWEMATDGLSWTFYIRKGIKFHNGDDLTAKDVKFSLDAYSAKDAYDADIRDSQERVEVLDDYTVRVYTKGVQPYYWRYVNFIPGSQGMILPKDYFEKVGKDYFELHPVGSGPFKFVSHVGGDSVEYEAVDKHYRQVPAFKKLTIILIPEETTRIAMLKSGGVDVIDIAVEAAAEVEATGFRTVSVAGSQATIHIYGTYDPRSKGLPTADIKVREALARAINGEELGRTLFYGKLGPAMPPYLWPDQPEIDLPYWKAEAAKVYRYDPEEAKRLLTEAGYPQGFSIKLYSMAMAGSAYLVKLAQVIQGYWLKIGVKAELVSIDQGAFNPMRKSGPNSGPADALVGQPAVRGANGNIVVARAMSGIFSKSGANDLTQGAIPDLEGLFKASLAEPNEAKRKEMVAKIVRLGMDTYTCLVIGTVPGMNGLGARVDIVLPEGAFALPMYVEAAKFRQK